MKKELQKEKQKFNKYPELYRATLSCKIGRDAIERKNVPDGTSAQDYAIFNLLHAIEDIAKHLMKEK